MSPAPARQPRLCVEKQSLIGQINKAIALIFSIHNEELVSVMGGDYTTDESIQHRLLEARELKALLIRRLRDHVEEHRC
jgi:hypothetical protein